MNSNISKREFLKQSGTAIAGVSLASTVSQSALGSRREGTRNQTGSKEDSTQGGQVSPQVANNVDLSADDYTIYYGEDTTISASWEVSTPLFAAKHSFVVLVEAENAEQPTLRASDFTASDIKKNFEYTHSSSLPVDYDAYKFKAVKQFLQPEDEDVNVELDATFEGDGFGDVQIQAGFPNDAQQPIGSIWAGAVVTVE